MNRQDAKNAKKTKTGVRVRAVSEPLFPSSWRSWRLGGWSRSGLAFLFLLTGPGASHGFINTFRPETLGAVCARSDSISVMRVDKVSKEKGVIVYTKVKDLKGAFPGEGLREVLGAAHEPHEKKHYLEWVEEGKTAVVFYYQKRVAVCIGDQWTVCEDPKGPPQDKGETWTVTTRTEPFFNLSYYGDGAKLPDVVADILAGKEVIVPCMAGERDKELRERKGQLIRMRTNLKQKEYDLKRDRVEGEGEKNEG